MPTGRTSSTANEPSPSPKPRELVANTAAALRDEYGIGRGDRVAIAAANRHEHVIAIWAVIVLGGAVVELNAWWTGAELERGIRLTDPKLLIGDDARLARLDHQVPDLHRADLDDAGTSWFAGDATLPTTPIDEDDPFVFLFTSGTTGRPKARGADASQQHPLGAVDRVAERGRRARRRPSPARSRRCRCSTSRGSPRRRFPR